MTIVPQSNTVAEKSPHTTLNSPNKLNKVCNTSQCYTPNAEMCHHPISKKSQKKKAEEISSAFLHNP